MRIFDLKEDKIYKKGKCYFFLIKKEYVGVVADLERFKLTRLFGDGILIDTLPGRLNGYEESL
jgi:hypothetical protein